MIVKDEFLKKLRAAFDLNIYEVKIWTALLSKGVASAGELSDISNVPRSRSYDVLESLEKKGFVMMKLGKPIKYLAVKPEDIVRRLKKSMQMDTDSRITYLEKFRQDPLFNEIDLLYKNGVTNVDPTALSGAVKGRDHVYHQLYTMLDKAESDVIIMTTEQGLARKVDKFKNLFKRLADRGVKIKVVAPLTKDTKKQLELLKNSVQMKTADHISARFVLVDGKEVLFFVTDDASVHETYDTGVWVNTPYFAGALQNLFTKTWNELPGVK